EDGIRDRNVTGVQTCALPISVLPLTQHLWWLLCAFLAQAPPTESTDRVLERRFTVVVQPFVKNYCLTCHGTKKQQAKLDLSGYTDRKSVVEGKKVEHMQWQSY